MPPRKSWSKGDMAKAVNAVKKREMGFLKASKTFNVPRSTLENYVNHPTKDIEDLLVVPLGRRPVLGSLEGELVDYCKAMDARFYGLRRRDIRVLAYQLAIKNNLPNTFAQLKGMAGEKWLKGFLRRNPTLAVRTPRAVALSRVKNFTREKVDAFFDLLKPELDKIKFSPHKIFNVDETGITVVQGTRSKVISVKGKKEVGKLSSAERGALITVVTCMSAAGCYVPPLLVFPRTNMKAELLDGCPPGTIAATHPSGWIQLPIFTDWLQHFINFVKPTKEDPVVLILDGHYSHTRNMAVIDLARENGVIIVCLPPHSTHRMQPLDVAFMAPFKKAYSNEIENWLDSHPFRGLTVYQVGVLFGRAYMRVATIETAVNGFRKCGIFPFDRLRFGPTDFIVEESTSDLTSSPPKILEPQPSTSKTVSPMDIRPLPDNNHKKTSNSGRKCGKAVVVTSSPYKAELLESLEKKSNENTAKTKTKRNLTKIKVETSKGKNLMNKKYQPKIGKKPSVGLNDPKETQKDVQVEIKQEKTLKVVKKLVFPKKRKNEESSDSDYSNGSVKLVSTDDEDSADECDCLYCGQPFKSNNRGEQWIRCTKCLLWAHELCAAIDNWKTFICDNCKNRS